MGQIILLPLRRKARCGFFPAGKIRRLRSGANPRSWVPEAGMLTTRPAKSQLYPYAVLCLIYFHVFLPSRNVFEYLTDTPDILTEVFSCIFYLTPSTLPPSPQYPVFFFQILLPPYVIIGLFFFEIYPEKLYWLCPKANLLIFSRPGFQKYFTLFPINENLTFLIYRQNILCFGIK
jgi:hypothetical protein